MLTNLADQPGQAAAGSDAPPNPEAGELRLPITLQDGRMSVGGLPIGPAPWLG